MASKRKNGGDDITSREKKKVKVTAARTIAVQSGARGAASSSSTPGPSGALSSLPATIDVEKFVEARAYEIEAMQSAMKSAPASATHRVWQTLPRHLRRRAASHDVRRVPLRLRDRAKAEMDPVSKKPFKISKRGKEKKVNRAEDFRRRQLDKAWLETHIWHAKRMHMENMWGYRLAVTPTDKAYRPSYRASVRSSIIHDASYYSLLQLQGPECMLISLLESCCDPQGPSPGSKRCATGARALETHIYGHETYPFNLIAPISVIWRPLQSSTNPKQDQGPALPKPNVPRNQNNPPMSNAHRELWLRFHPSVHGEVFEVLKTAASATLEIFKTRPGFVPGSSLDILDLKGQVNAFELMGPKANQVIRSALKPTPTNHGDSFKQFWSSLRDIGSSGSLPRGMIIGFKVDDPRLSFPPKNIQQDENYAANAPITISSPALASSEIWDPQIRDKLAKPRYKKRDLDARRSKNDVPGTRLNPLRQDDRIPVMLIQRSIGDSSAAGGPDGESIHGWTLIIPSGWSMAFFESLIHTGTRVAGQREQQTQSYEAGIPYFPRDYPTTDSCRTFAEHQALLAKETWERKPPAKRVNYDSLGSSNPWKADWEGILGIEKKDDSSNNFSSTQRDPADEGMSDEATSPPQILPWLLHGCDVPDIVAALPSSSTPPAPSLTPSHTSSPTSAAATALYAQLNKYRAKRNYVSGPLNLGTAGAPSISSLLQGALVTMSITMCARGTPEDLAMIYAVPDDIVKKWEALHKRLKQKKNKGKGKAKASAPIGDGSDDEALRMEVEEESPEEMELAQSSFSRESILGYVTTGHFSLSRGQGFAIGTVALKRLLELQEQNSRLYGNQSRSDVRQRKFFVAIRNANSSLYRAAHLRIHSEEQ